MAVHFPETNLAGQERILGRLMGMRLRWGRLPPAPLGNEREHSMPEHPACSLCCLWIWQKLCGSYTDGNTDLAPTFESFLQRNYLDPKHLKRMSGPLGSQENPFTVSQNWI